MEKGLEFLKRIYKKDQEKKQNNNSKIQKFTPKFMYVSVTAPHLPLQPAKRHLSKKDYWKTQFEKYVINRTGYNEEDISDKSSWLKDRY